MFRDYLFISILREIQDIRSGSAFVFAYFFQIAQVSGGKKAYLLCTFSLRSLAAAFFGYILLSTYF